ncbi:hypothetical protein [Intrasporangium sp.]|uniref:sunset domain-containing protein n=1 Tax=Intrasporangium sp. TaxID=1925024 RepID=UPI0032221812
MSDPTKLILWLALAAAVIAVVASLLAASRRRREREARRRARSLRAQPARPAVAEAAPVLEPVGAAVREAGEGHRSVEPAAPATWGSVPENPAAPAPVVPVRSESADVELSQDGPAATDEIVAPAPVGAVPATADGSAEESAEPPVAVVAEEPLEVAEEPVAVVAEVSVDVTEEPIAAAPTGARDGAPSATTTAAGVAAFEDDEPDLADAENPFGPVGLAPLDLPSGSDDIVTLPPAARQPTRRVSTLAEVRDGGYGLGSAAPIADGAQPLGHAVKAVRATGTYLVPGCPGYDEAAPDVWFYDERVAYRVGYRPGPGVRAPWMG